MGTEASGNRQSPRATDQGRHRATNALDDAFARGALSVEEHDARVAQALVARDENELSSLTDDLPAPAQADVERAARQSDIREWIDEWRWWCGGALIMSTIWGVQAIRSGADFFWPIVPLGIWAAILIAIAIWPRPSG